MPLNPEPIVRPAPPSRLTDETFDLLVIGGGITGAALAWLATVSGRSVALVEQSDFAVGASAASQKIIHSGLRYLQRLDLARCASAIDDRQRLARLAPHLVGPMECALPLYGATVPARAGAALYRAMLAYRGAIGVIGAPRIVSGRDILARIPEIDDRGLRGAIVWEDGAVFDTERLVVAFARSAAARGAVVANHVEALAPRPRAGRIEQVEMKARGEETEFSVRARSVVDCMGQWQFLAACRNLEQPAFVAGLNVVTEAVSATDMGFGVPDPRRRGGPTWFVTPWRGRSIIGTRWFEAGVDTDGARWPNGQVERLLEDFNRTFAGRELTTMDVLDVHWARVPRRAGADPGDGRATLEYPRILDHAAHGMAGAFSVLATKYTACLSTAHRVLARLPGGFSKPDYEKLPRLVGGDIENWHKFRHDALATGVPEEMLRAYGSEAPSLTDGANSLRRCVRHAVECEMALTLSDTLLRRLGKSSAVVPDRGLVETASEEMALALGWDAGERSRQVEQLYRQFEVR